MAELFYRKPKRIGDGSKDDGSVEIRAALKISALQTHQLAVLITQPYRAIGTGLQNFCAVVSSTSGCNFSGSTAVILASMNLLGKMIPRLQQIGSMMKKLRKGACMYFEQFYLGCLAH